MGTELSITRELANIAATITEFSAITRIFRGEIQGAQFNTSFNVLVDNLVKTYNLIEANLLPLLELKSEDIFIAHFDERYSAYRDCFLDEACKPRIYTENVYQAHLLLKTLKESKTTYPLLKRTFIRLEEFVDKWIDNDVWLAMSIDNLFKMLNRLLIEIAELKNKDLSEAYLIYQNAFSDFKLFIDLIINRHNLMCSAVHLDTSLHLDTGVEP